MSVQFHKTLPLLGFVAFAGHICADETSYASLNAEGAGLLLQNRLAEASAKLEAARGSCGDCTELPAILNNLAVLARRKGAYSDAIALHNQALSLRERHDGADALSVLGILNNLSVAYREAGQFVNARAVAERAVSLTVIHQADETSGGADAYANLGSILTGLGEVAEGRRLLERSLSVRRTLFGPADPTVGETLNELALAYKQSGQLSAAAELTSRAVAILSAVPATSLLLPAVENNLGRILMDQKRLKEAERCFRQAIAHAQKQFGPEDPAAAVGMTNLAALLGARHQFAEAEKWMDRATRIDLRAYSPHHMRVAYDVSTAGFIAFERKNYSRAESLFQEAAGILGGIYPPTHPEIGRISANLGEIYLKQHRAEEAERAFAAASVSMEATYGPDSPELLAALQRYSVALRAAQKFAEAASVEAKAMRIQVQRALHPPVDSGNRAPA